MSPFDLAGLREQSKKLTEKTLDPDFWNDTESAQKVIKEKTAIDKKIEQYEQLEKEIDDIEEYVELAEEMEDEEEAKEILRSFRRVKKEFAEFRRETLLTGKYDHNSAIVTIHAGAGGVDAQDWAEMLLRMYTRWASSKGFETEIVDLQDDTEAGIKGATFFVNG